MNKEHLRYLYDEVEDVINSSSSYFKKKKSLAELFIEVEQRIENEKIEDIRDSFEEKELEISLDKAVERLAEELDKGSNTYASYRDVLVYSMTLYMSDFIYANEQSLNDVFYDVADEFLKRFIMDTNKYKRLSKENESV